MENPRLTSGTERPLTPAGAAPQSRHQATKIAAWYAVLGAAWILGSGWVLHQLVHNPATEAWLETLKGWFYVGATAILLKVALGRYFGQLEQSTELAQENEIRLRRLGDNLPEGYVYQYFYDESGCPHFRYISAGVERVTGLTVEQVLGDAGLAHAQIGASEHERLVAAERESAEKMTDFSMEVHIRRPDGDVRALQLKSRPRRNARGRVEWDGFAVDVTKMRQAEAAARVGEERLRLFIETAAVALAMFDRKMGYLAVSPRWRADFHLGDQELIGRCHYDVFPEIPQSLKAVHARCLGGEVVRGDDERFERADGTVQWLRWDARPWRTTDGTVGGIIISSEEVTEQKRIEEERARLAAAMEQAAEAICITDTAARILYVNPAFEKSSGFSRQEALGRTPGILKSGKQDPSFYEHLWSVLRSGEVWRGHFINKRKDGSLFEEDAAISPVRDQTGVVTNYVAIKLDVTREMALQAELRQSQKLEAIGQLAGGVAHDFNNLLAVILVQSEELLEEEMSPSMRSCLQDIKKAAERASTLTRQLLLFSRRQVMQPRILDVNEVVTNLAKMLRRILGEDIQLRLDLHSKPLLTNADAGMIEQVLMNLSVNARDAMPSGGRLTVATGARSVDASTGDEDHEVTPGRYVWFCVHDDGEGISPDVLPHIFEPFFTTKEPGKGTGLGLATVFGIIRQHGGWVDVRSEVGQGTTFHIFLPASHVEGTQADEGSPKPKPRGGSETILLVEDEPSVSRVVRSILERHGYRVLDATHGKPALEIGRQGTTHIDLLLTDMVLPGGMNGLEIATELRALMPALRVVFMTGYSPELAGHSLELQAGDGFIQKPFRPDTVLSAVRQALDD